MASAPSTTPRLLFVLDNDYGGLGLVMYLLHGQPLAAGALLLLPPGAHELHAGALSVASRPYRSLPDILGAVEAHRPHAVVLVSGYLFPSQGLLKAGEVGALVEALRRRGCKVATTDPYLGTFRSLPGADLGWLEKLKLAVHVRRLGAILAGMPHIYPSPIEPDPGGTARHSFFNPLYIGERPSLSARSWLFVLARFDLEWQERQHGREGFADRVARKVGETIASGREATFIGPAPIVEGLRRRFPEGQGVTLLTRCAYPEFERRLLEAEVAFYWQLFPTSAFMRLWNALPTFFFDRGHNARLLEPLYAAGLEHYYLGTKPAFLDIDRPLEASALLGMKPGFARSAQESLRRLERLPGPAEMVGALLNAA
jgi:hypothetical protein